MTADQKYPTWGYWRELDDMDDIVNELFPQAEDKRKPMADASLRQYVHPEDVTKGERERS